MNPLRDDMDDEERIRPGSDREITLGTTTILLIFFALAVYGAALFGFGYSLGSKHTPGSPAPVASAPSSTFNTFKPAPGSPIGAPGKPATTDSTAVPNTLPPLVIKTVPLPAPIERSPSEAAETDHPAPARPAPTAQPNAPPPSAPPAPGVVSVIVQVAALSQQSDAELVATTLQRRGYAVNVHLESDKLYHVQVGPFTSRKDAEAMKARLLADGFNAYIK